jgi:hypothetical protein
VTYNSKYKPTKSQQMKPPACGRFAPVWVKVLRPWLVLRFLNSILLRVWLLVLHLLRVRWFNRLHPLLRRLLLHLHLHLLGLFHLHLHLLDLRLLRLLRLPPLVCVLRNN